MNSKESKESIIRRLDEIDKEELEINQQLKKYQMELNEYVSDSAKLEVNKELTENYVLPTYSKYVWGEKINKNES